jgi:hypothetical protein
LYSSGLVTKRNFDGKKEEKKKLTTVWRVPTMTAN